MLHCSHNHEIGMKSLIALLLGFVAALFATGIEEAVFGASSGWVALLVAVPVFVIVLHRLQLGERHL
jgi:hypothetical protein